YLKVVYDEDRDEFMEIHVEIEDPSTIFEPTFEDVMTLWIAVIIWGTQLILGRLLYKKVGFKIT
ncbi:16952_t:CDS:2, partial [Funneliformis caledonium]